jgi:hypothetical protein
MISKFMMYIGFAAALVVLLTSAVASGQAIIDPELRLISTDKITVRWDINHAEKILSIELNSNPGNNLTTYSHHEFTGASWITHPADKRMISFNSVSIEWSAKFLDPEGNSAQVATRSQLAGRPPVKTVYEFRADSARIDFQRTFAFSEVPFLNEPTGLIPMIY